MKAIEQYIRRKVFWIKDWLHGGQMWHDFKEVQFIMSHPKEGYAIRQQKLTEILAYAKENTVFYKQYASAKTLADFPVVNKSVYKEHYQDFCVPIGRIPRQKGPLHIQKTSGSTGTPFEVPQDTRCRIRRLATLKAMNELVGFHSFCPLMHLRSFQHYWGGAELIRYEKSVNIVYADNANLSNERLSGIVDAINKHKIKYVRGYVTCLDSIARYALDNNVELTSHPTFITGGELLPYNVMNHIRQLNCNVTSQYANEESGVFGQSVLNGNPTTIILNRANCIVEILKMDADEPVEKGELGRVVITDFTNYAFPMIRYDIGDVAMLGDITEDGDLLNIQNLTGRKQDLITRTDGSQVDMFNSIPKEVYNNPHVRQWQFMQKAKNRYILYINGSLRKQGGVIDDLKVILGEDAEIEIITIDTLPVLNSGKRKIIVNEYLK